MFLATPSSALLTAIVGVLVGLPLGSFLSAVFLRLALWLAGLSSVSFGKALKATLTANGILLALASMYWAMAIVFQSLADVPLSASVAWWLTPHVYFYYVFGLVLLHAVVFRFTLSAGEASPGFGQSTFVALTYLAISFFVASLLIFLVIAMGEIRS